MRRLPASSCCRDPSPSAPAVQSAEISRDDRDFAELRGFRERDDGRFVVHAVTDEPQRLREALNAEFGDGFEVQAVER
jgi:hypothetical protein